MRYLAVPSSSKAITRIRASAASAQVVICGSMKVYGLMSSLADQLEGTGVRVTVPEPDSVDLLTMPAELYDLRKRRASLAYFKTIMQPATFGVLAANFDVRGVPDYVGANTFAELAVAFAHGKRIFLLQGFPDRFSDELRAWNAIPLHGDFSSLIELYKSSRATTVVAQSTLF